MNHKELENLIVETVLKHTPKNKKIGVLYSGGVDSVLIAKILKDNNIDFTCYTASSIEDYKDASYAKKSAEELGFKLKIVNSKDLEKDIKEVSKITKNLDYITISIALPLYIAMKKAKEDKIDAVFSGIGTEELFAGYERHLKAKDINEECLKGLKNIKERDLNRDESLANHLNIKLLIPFLDKKLIDYSLKIPSELKIKEGYKKFILRQAAENLGVPKEYAWRKKLAVQYGSGIDKELEKLAKSKGFRFKSDYIHFLLTKRIGALLSTGKDSIFAIYKMKQKGYTISCLLTMKSINKDSFMFHTPNINLAEEIADLMKIPIIVKNTKGEKEKELEDLENLISESVKKYKIEGIVSGAVASEYQKKRIETICKKFNIESYTPLWDRDQEELLEEMIEKGFKIMITKTAAEGLDKNWEGKILDETSFKELKKLSKKYNFSIIGEGGEYESLVIDSPLYKKPLNK